MLNRSVPSRQLAGYLTLLFFTSSGPAYAQVIVAQDDIFEVPASQTLLVEAFGVLENDTLDDEAAGENGATAELVSGTSHGALSLSPDGSFTYSPGASFKGTDTFVYRGVFGGASDQATVTLTACAGGPQIFTCWKKDAFLAKAAELGHPYFTESFEEDSVWGPTRSPDTLLSVSSRGFDWRANDFDPTHVDPPQPPPPPPHQLTTGTGAAIVGQWGLYDPNHGYATGTAIECDIDNPPDHCLYHDGFTMKRQAGESAFFGAGGFFTGFHGARVAIVLDGDWQNPIGGGVMGSGESYFFGVIDAGPTGFTEVQFREVNGKVGQALFIWGDHFTLLSQPVAPLPTLGIPGIMILGLLLVAGAIRYLRHASVDQ